MKNTLLVMLAVLFYWTAQGQTPGQTKFKEAQEYYFGLGKPYDPSKAFQLYTEAANAGYPDAMNTLANMYAGGVTVEADYKTAFSWYEKAGNAGSALAWNNLAMFYRRGEVVPQDFSRAFCIIKKVRH